MHLLERGQGMELPVARDAARQILPDCVDRLREALRAFSGRQAHCAIPARGVSLRTLSLPTAVPEEIARILPLQMEAIFPLAPSELAWGYSASPGTNGILVAAVKREVLNDYRSLLASAGLDARAPAKVRGWVISFLPI